jgi:hypothetical protein
MKANYEEIGGMKHVNKRLTDVHPNLKSNLTTKTLDNYPPANTLNNKRGFKNLF